MLPTCIFPLLAPLTPKALLIRADDVGADRLWAVVSSGSHPILQCWPLDFLPPSPPADSDLMLQDLTPSPILSAYPHTILALKITHRCEWGSLGPDMVPGTGRDQKEEQDMAPQSLVPTEAG